MVVNNFFSAATLRLLFHNTKGCRNVCGLTPRAFLFCFSVSGPPFLNRFLIELIYLKGKGIVFSDKEKDFAEESVRPGSEPLVRRESAIKKTPF